MIDFSGKTFAELMREALANVPDTFDKRDTSPINTALGPAAYALEAFYIALNNVQKSAFVSSAAGEDLDALALLAGIERQQASYAVRRGIFNASVAIGARFASVSSALTFICTGASVRPSISAALDASTWTGKAMADGTYNFLYTGASWTLNGSNVQLSAYGITLTGTFYTGDTVTVVSVSQVGTISTTPAAGITAMTLTAEEAGSSGNSYTGALLPITNIPSLTLCEVTEVLVSGDDEETDEELRARITEALKRKPFAGNVAAYREAALEIDGVSAVQVYPTWNGAGTVKLSLLGGDDYLPASVTVVSNVQTAIDPTVNQGAGVGLAPIGAVVTVNAATALNINVAATLTMEAGYTIESVQQAVEEAIAAYLLTIRKQWSRQVSDTSVSYSCVVYHSQVIASILSVPHIENVQSLTLNGSAADITLTETSATQQVPALGTVVLT